MNDYEYLDCYAGDIEDDKLYVVSVLFGIVLEYDLKNFSYKVLTQINLPDSSQLVRVNSIVKIKNLFYMTLWNSWNVFKFDIESKQLEVYGNDFEYIDGEELVVKSCMYQDKIWLFPYDIRQKIRIFHIKTKEFTVSISVEEILGKKGYGIKKENFICLDIFHEKNKCFLAVYNSPYILEVNLETENCNVYTVKHNAKIEMIFYADGQYWFSYIDSKIIEKWSPAGGILEVYEPQKMYTQDKWKYRYVFEYGEKIVVIPTQDKGIYIIDKQTRQETVLKYSEDNQKVHNEERWMFYGFAKYNDKIILLPFSMTHFNVIDLENERLESYSGKFGADIINEYYIKTRFSQSILVENNIFGFPEYLNFLSEYDSIMNEKVSKVGGTIWIQLK